MNELCLLPSFSSKGKLYIYNWVLVVTIWIYIIIHRTWIYLNYQSHTLYKSAAWLVLLLQNKAIKQAQDSIN
jgi:hypothetical protein